MTQLTTCLEPALPVLQQLHDLHAAAAKFKCCPSDFPAALGCVPTCRDLPVTIGVNEASRWGHLQCSKSSVLTTGRDGGRGACLGCPPSWDMCPQRNTPRPRRCAHPRQRCRSCLPPSAWTPTICLMAEILPESFKSLLMSRLSAADMHV